MGKNDTVVSSQEKGASHHTLVVCSFASSYWLAVTIHPRGILLGGYQLGDIRIKCAGGGLLPQIRCNPIGSVSTS